MPPENLIVSTGFAVIRPKAIGARFLGYLLLSEFVVAEIISRSVGVSYPAINASEIMRLKLPVPPLGEQSRIVDFLKGEITKLDSLLKAAVDAVVILQERRSALISAAVTGKIDVQGEVDAEMVEA
jgi:type I restriction enzyme S subunit